MTILALYMYIHSYKLTIIMVILLCFWFQSIYTLCCINRRLSLCWLGNIDTSFPCLQLFKLLTYYLIRIKTSSCWCSHHFLIRCKFLRLRFSKKAYLNRNFHILTGHLQTYRNMTMSHPTIHTQYPRCKAFTEEIPLFRFFESKKSLEYLHSTFTLF